MSLQRKFIDMLNGQVDGKRRVNQSRRHEQRYASLIFASEFRYNYLKSALCLSPTAKYQ
jgi:hypothetical protein